MSKDIERAELGTLTGKTITITIDGREYTMREPTLAVLDCMTAVWIEFPDVSRIKTLTDVNTALPTLRKHLRPMARAVAMALIGEGMFAPFGRIRLWLTERKIYHSLRPAELLKLTEVITATSGLVNFIVSMRSMSAARTTAPKTSVE